MRPSMSETIRKQLLSGTLDLAMYRSQYDLTRAFQLVEIIKQELIDEKLLCQVHGEPFVETHPADVENGPSPHDVENELICFACENEWQIAYWESLCIEHRLTMDRCFTCATADFEETTR